MIVMRCSKHCATAPLVGARLPIELFAVQPSEGPPGIRGDGVGVRDQGGELLVESARRVERYRARAELGAGLTLTMASCVVLRPPS